MAAIWTWLKLKFSIKVGKLIKLLVENAAHTIATDILNEENQAAAYMFVKELSKQDMTAQQKAIAFNYQMSQWAKKAGKTLAESTINCLRELAVNALKVSS